MRKPDWNALVRVTGDLLTRHLESLDQLPVSARADARTMLARLDGPMPEHGEAPETLLPWLAETLAPGLTAMPSGRFFGWVMGGTLPGALATDWLTSAYDQPAGMAEPTPAASMAEQVALTWVREVLDLPHAQSAALVTGGQMANTTCLQAGRNAVLHDAGWDVEARGLHGAPPITVIVGADCHTTIARSLRMLGLGTDCVVRVPCDNQGAMRADAFGEVLARTDGPTLVCAQAGNVDTGAFDPVGELVAAIGDKRGRVWLHVDGAFGLWARASRAHRHLTAGVEGADSWATDAHKWLNTPYDCGIAMTRDRDAHRRAFSARAAYLPPGDSEEIREPVDYTPELSRRARGLVVYAALRELGRKGVEDLVDRCCRHARRFAEALGSADGVEIRNDVVLNQVLVHFRDPEGNGDNAHTERVMQRVKAEGVCFMSGTERAGVRLMRISVSNWSTDDADVEVSIASVLRAHAGG